VPQTADRVESLLAGLNGPQREAVEHGDGPLLILAGAGSGKTRVLTHRLAHLVLTERVQRSEVLAITFTNKAAQEMRERVELLLGARTRGMWVMTFHAACARLLRAEAPRLGYTRQFTIYDQSDSRRAVKHCLEELDADPKRFSPAAVQAQISDAKNRLRDAEAYRQLVGSYFEQTVADAFELYEQQLLRMNAMDFDDLLVRTVNVLELFPEVRERYQATFRHVLVDEYQDTNHAQYRLLQLLAGAHRNLAVVGDDDQCVVEGTLVTMADGSLRPVEAVRVGDSVLSGLGGGQFGPARVTSVFRSHREEGVAIETAAGRRLVSTPEHVHFAGSILTFGSPGPKSQERSPELVLCGAGAGRHALTLPALARLDARVRCMAQLGSGGAQLPFAQARDVKPGMAMFTPDGCDVVARVERVALDKPVYDLNIARTHNFVANGLVTHNSIYGFRGADIRNILEFRDDYPDAKVVRLEQNYRSTQTILDVANAVIAHNRGRMGKQLFTELGEGDKVKVRELDDDRAEARYVVGEIERLVDEGMSLGEVAVFYRTNAQSRTIEDVLRERELHYQVVGGVRFYDRAEVKDALAYLTFLLNGHDVVAFQRIVNSPKRGLGTTSVSRVLSHAATMESSIWEAAMDATVDGIPGLGTAARKALTRFMETVESLRERAEQRVPVGDLLEAVLHETGYLDALEAERTFEAQGRIENLQELVVAAREFDATAEEDANGLGDYLQRTSLTSDADSRRDDEGVVTLMTLHNAKGLEYPVVFIMGMEDGVFPHSRALDEGGLEEERRLCYVGITRAMRDLYLTYARRRSIFGAVSYGLRSRFLDEVPAELTDRDTADDIRAAPGAIRATTWASTRTDAPAADFRLGEDVVHPAFGEGVVTAVEPGGIVVVRFAKDGSERKLMAEYAPISRR
jgi:superfamily I DNA/RNA helicase